MRRVRVIGIGCHAGQLTVEAADALRSVAYVIAADKGAGDSLLALRRALCERYGVPLVAVPDPERDRDDPTDYTGAVRDWHDARAAAYETVLRERPGDVGFLVWGDPAFYDSTVRVVERLAARLDLEYDVLPGVSAISLLAARHRLVLHEVGRPVLITTGRRLLADAATHDNLLVMLDGSLACARLDGEWQLWWGANLGSQEERLVAGALEEVVEQVREARAQVRETAGWVMDTYLLRRRAPAAQL